MKIEATPEVLKWFHNELSISSGMGIRFFGKVYGSTNVHDGFSVGMSVDQPENPVYKVVLDELLFFIEDSDAWFFQNYKLLIDYDEKLDEPKYVFESE